MDNDTNLNAVVRHMWSARALTKVVAQVINNKQTEVQQTGIPDERDS